MGTGFGEDKQLQQKQTRHIEEQAVEILNGHDKLKKSE
jgi:hypothetical protein